MKDSMFKTVEQISKMFKSCFKNFFNLDFVQMDLCTSVTLNEIGEGKL